LTIPGASVSSLPHDLQPGESVDVSVRFQTPKTPGRYLLAVEPFARDFDWFSNSGVPPFYIEADIEPGLARYVEEADLSAWYRLREKSIPASMPEASRSVLWKAAFKMFVAHPWGVGPDNYRLQVGKVLGVARWNTDIHSNNAYLELLTGSGMLGLGAFLAFIASIRWRLEVVCLALAVLLVHSLVDSFFMSTPLYFAFWTLAGFTPQKEFTTSS
jgi:hypothetical protein